MHDATPWWTWLGRLFPSDVRERVFEPACYDRLREGLEHRSTGGLGVGLYAINAFLGTAGRNLPRIWFENRGLSGIGRLAVGMGLSVVGAWVVLIVRYVYAY